ncbi:hypothetical protein JXM83_02670 [Candidatus Woesearchaeota archaeon]|nr:hypothetical protein [Candidatus Woesearchaeota archaeon]
MYYILFAVALMGLVLWFIMRDKSFSHVSIPSWLVIVALVVTLFTRIYWYFFSPVPLGYDPGWYKFVFDHPFAENWVKSVFPLLFSLLGSFFSLIFGSANVVKWGIVILSVGLCYAFYYFLSKMFNNSVGVLSALLYSVSYTMYKVFWWNYIKNILGMILLLAALYFLLKKDSRILTVLFGGLLGGIHRPAALIFGVIYVAYFLYHRRKVVFVDGILIILLMLLFNIDRIPEFCLGPFMGYVTSLGSSGSGTFFNLSTYVYYSLMYIPFVLIGAFYKRSLLVVGLLFTFITVVFELFFFNRFIIYLDFFMLIFAAIGIYYIIGNNRKLGLALFGYLLIVSGVNFYSGLIGDHALITSSEFDFISSLEGVVVTTPTYATWVKGYSSATVYAPGMFDNNPFDRNSWLMFWNGSIDFVEPVYSIYTGGVDLVTTQ